MLACPGVDRQFEHKARGAPRFVGRGRKCARRLHAGAHRRFHATRSAAIEGRPAHVALVRATSAALMPSNARPYPTPSSMMRRSFWVSAMRVYLVGKWRQLGEFSCKGLVGGDGGQVGASQLTRAPDEGVMDRVDVIEGTRSHLVGAYSIRVGRTEARPPRRIIGRPPHPWHGDTSLLC